MEKSDLVERLRQSRLPAHVKARMDAVILSRSGTGAPTAAHAHAPASVQSSVPAEIVPELTAEEQTSVAVFKLCSRSAGGSLRSRLCVGLRLIARLLSFLPSTDRSGNKDRS